MEENQSLSSRSERADLTFFFYFFFFSSFLVCYGATVVEHFLRAKVFFWGGLPECVVIIMRKEQKRYKNKKKLKNIKDGIKNRCSGSLFFILISQRNFNKKFLKYLQRGSGTSDVNFFEQRNFNKSFSLYSMVVIFVQKYYIRCC